MGLSDVMDDWFGFDPPEKPKLPVVSPPPTIEKAMGVAGTLRRSRPQRGRASTILTGDLVPMDIGKRTLLG